MKYPKFLEKGEYIATTAPSGGITKEIDFIRLDNVKKNFDEYGYRYLETDNVRREENGRSSSSIERANQFMSVWKNDEVGAIISAAGGDFLNEMLDELDFNELKNLPPKWFQGYSDNTGITFLLTTICDIACIYGQTIKDFGMKDLHRSLISSFDIMSGKEVVQKSFDKCEGSEWVERMQPYAGYELVNDVKWKNVNDEEKVSFRGRSIGGCFDVIINLIGTKYDHVKEYIEKYKDDGIVWFLEVFEMSTPQIYLHLWQMRQAGFFENCNGIVFGRGLFVREEYEMSVKDAIKEATRGLEIPVVFDADIGHVSPQMPIVSGAIIEVTSQEGKGSIRNYFN